ncbi:MAG: glycosyltransferase family 4 protein [Flavobacteriaceae bacterium]
MVKSKRILIISPFFFPEPISTGKFNTDMVLALRDKGHKVTVICSHPLYPKWVPEKSEEQLSEIKIIRGGGNLRYSKRPVLRRATLEIWYAFFVMLKIFRHRKQIDIIIPVFPPSLAFYVIRPLLKKNTIKIGMVHDLQEVYTKSKKGILNKSIGFLIKIVEQNTFKACHKLIFLSKEMKETAKVFYSLNNDKLTTQYPFSTIMESEMTNDLEEILPKEKTHIVYSGALGEKQNPNGVYDFFNRASQKLNNICFHFFSQGHLFEKLKSRNNNPKIFFHDLVPRKNIEELYKRSSVQIIPQLSGTSKGSLPSKLPNLLLSGCNILFITDKGSEIENLFIDHKLNKVVTSWNHEILFNALNEILRNLNSDKENQIKVAKELFSINSMTEKITS